MLVCGGVNYRYCYPVKGTVPDVAILTAFQICAFLLVNPVALLPSRQTLPLLLD